MKQYPHACLIFALCMLLACDPSAPAAPPPDTPPTTATQQRNNATTPSIIHIFVDDLGYGDLGCFGATDIATPNIDRLAAEGIKFTEFYSASAVCSPSRAALMTGRYPVRMGINEVFFPESFTGMPPEEITIAEVLKPLGYATGMVGKWHLGHMERYLPLNQGFDSYYGMPYSNDMESAVYLSGNEVDSFQVNQRYLTQTYTRHATDFIRSHAGEPFFLYLAHNMPHVPLYASPEFVGSSERGLYGDVVQELDWSVGQVLQTLDSLGIAENTLVIFSSDNGPWLVMEDHGGDAGALREGKQYTFEGGMRVPTVARWPARIPAGQVYDELATQMDWLPTFAALTGAELPTDRPIDGRDLTAVLEGTGERADQGLLYIFANELRAYRHGDYKVKLPYRGFAGSPGMKAVAAHDTLLFNLKEDPGERNNLLAQEPERARALLEEMHREYDNLLPLPEQLVIRGRADHSHYDHVREYLARRDGRASD